MEYVVSIGILGLLLLVAIVKEMISGKCKDKQFRESLLRNYGKEYYAKRNWERYVHVPAYFLCHKKSGQIDDITWNDLDMDELFECMNYTFSSAGEEYLYYTLRNADKSKEELEHFEELVHFFAEHPDKRVEVQTLMKKLGTTGKFSLYDYIDYLKKLGKRSNTKHYVWIVLFAACIGLIPFATAIAVGGLVTVMCVSILTYFKEKREIEPYIISFVYIMRLLSISDKLQRMDIPVCEAEFETIRKNRTTLQKVRQFSSIVLKDTAVTSGNPVDILFDYLRMTFHLDLIVFNRMLSSLQEHINAIDEIIGTVGGIETTIAVGIYRKLNQETICIPEILGPEEKDFEIVEGYHPRCANPVKNTIKTQKGVLLTGSNASGKSTFLKMVAINALLAQTIHTCHASSYKAPLFQIYSSMSLRDDLEGGESYYIVEIKSLKRILQASQEIGKRVLCFVDEVLRGTNTVERIAASTQIMKSLSGNQYLCFAATHDIELTHLLEHEYNNYHFEEEIRDGDIYFKYILLEGRATTRNAIKLLEIIGYDKQIIEEASNQASRFIETGAWS